MKTEYDFAAGDRGRFLREGAAHSIPIHLEADVLQSLNTQAEHLGVSIGTLVNALLRRTVASATHPTTEGHAEP